jgi:hypothetical protein
VRTIVVTGPGIVELNWMWLPTFIGSDAATKKKVEEELRAHVVGKELTEATLDHINDLVVEVLMELHPAVSGLDDYLDGLKFVSYG